MRKLLLLSLLLVAGPAFAKKAPKPPPRPTVTASEAGELIATLQTSRGDIMARLYEKEAPKAVANFVALATGTKEWKNALGQWVKVPLFDGTTFHRVIPGFMIQGGDPNSRADGDPSGLGRGNPGFRFEDEPNAHKFDRGGYLAMANSGPNTNSSQFFITETAQTHLNGMHTIFGEVIWGQELVAQIANAGDGNVKLTTVAIVRGTVVMPKTKGKKKKP